MPVHAASCCIMLYHAVSCHTVQYRGVARSRMLYTVCHARHTKTQHNTTQHSTAQHSVTQKQEKAPKAAAMWQRLLGWHPQRAGLTAGTIARARGLCPFPPCQTRRRRDRVQQKRPNRIPVAQESQKAKRSHSTHCGTHARQHNTA